MLVTEIYNGQGLGNQLACYVTTRVVSLDKGYEFGIMNPFKFKCLDFMELDFGLPVIGGESPDEGAPPTILPDGIEYYFREKDIRHPNGSDIRIDDLKLETIVDNTKLDGVFQSENRIIHRKKEIKEWLKVKPEMDCYTYSDKDICIIHIRGGDFRYIGATLDSTYYNNAMNKMLSKNKNIKFLAITDDVNYCKSILPNIEIVGGSAIDYVDSHRASHHLGGRISVDYTIIKNAHNLILSNSSFPYFAIFTSDIEQYIIAPKYWIRYSISDGYWSCGYNIYRNHNYLDKNNNIFSFDECMDEFNIYKEKNKHLYK